MSTTDTAARAEAALSALAEHEAAWGTDLDTMPAGQRERRQRLHTAARNASLELEDTLAAEAERDAKLAAIRAAARDPRNIERTDRTPTPAARNRANPWDSGSGDDLLRMDTPTGLRTRALDAAEYAADLPDAARALLTAVVERDDAAASSALVLAGLDPAYRSAFAKWLPDPTRGHLLWTAPEREAYARAEAIRAAMSLTDANGGFLVPFTLDPSVVLTSAGVVGAWRQYATVDQTTTNEWNGVKSAGVTAEWLPEGAVAADASPAFGRLNIPVHKLAAYVSGSFEIWADSNIASQLPTMLAESFAEAEAAVFATGSGSGAPTGLVTAVAAVTASRVATTTGGTFTLSDLYAAQEATPPRARYGRSPAFVASLPILNMVRQFDTAGGASTWVNLGDGTPPRVLDMAVVESSAMTTTTTTGSNVAVLGDLSRFLIIDRLGTTLVPHPSQVDPTTGRPNGTTGLFAYRRVGSDVSDPSVFRVIQT